MQSENYKLQWPIKFIYLVVLVAAVLFTWHAERRISITSRAYIIDTHLIRDCSFPDKSECDVPNSCTWSGAVCLKFSTRNWALKTVVAESDFLAY